MAVPPQLPEEIIREAMALLNEVEGLIATVPRQEILGKLDNLRDFVDELTRYQVDVRLMRLRLQSKLSPPEDPDKTPVHGISSDKLRAAKIPNPIKK